MQISPKRRQAATDKENQEPLFLNQKKAYENKSFAKTPSKTQRRAEDYSPYMNRAA